MLLRVEIFLSHPYVCLSGSLPIHCRCSKASDGTLFCPKSTMYNVRINLINILWPWLSVTECISKPAFSFPPFPFLSSRRLWSEIKAERKHQHSALIDQILISGFWCQKGEWSDEICGRWTSSSDHNFPSLLGGFSEHWNEIACHSSPRLSCFSSSPVVCYTSAAMTVQGWNPVLLVISLWLTFESAGELPPKFRERKRFWSTFLFLHNVQSQLLEILHEECLKYNIIFLWNVTKEMYLKCRLIFGMRSDYFFQLVFCLLTDQFEVAGLEVDTMLSC